MKGLLFLFLISVSFGNEVHFESWDFAHAKPKMIYQSDEGDRLVTLELDRKLERGPASEAVELTGFRYKFGKKPPRHCQDGKPYEGKIDLGQQDRTLQVIACYSNGTFSRALRQDFFHEVRNFGASGESFAFQGEQLVLGKPQNKKVVFYQKKKLHWKKIGELKAPSQTHHFGKKVLWPNQSSLLVSAPPLIYFYQKEKKWKLTQTIKAGNLLAAGDNSFFTYQKTEEGQTLQWYTLNNKKFELAQVIKNPFVNEGHFAEEVKIGQNYLAASGEQALYLYRKQGGQYQLEQRIKRPQGYSFDLSQEQLVVAQKDHLAVFEKKKEGFRFAFKAKASHVLYSAPVALWKGGFLVTTRSEKNTGMAFQLLEFSQNSWKKLSSWPIHAITPLVVTAGADSFWIRSWDEQTRRGALTWYLEKR